MRPNALIAALALAPLASACKCYPWGKTPDDIDITASHYCCWKFKGRWDDAVKDCEAHSIKNKLNSFMRCCVEHVNNSDCWKTQG
ncbi:hypothetical protein ESCO_003372 [Escovopsis weberi]|uniref:Extracellular membrane protein CFEM domain-containing protein n=1 Tax=Escovopsis weberi TaxID=150374 RepID=A0A0M9VXH0_ESCWE|nr:hypothetical protein ESCO_003372 [Escovopsis weberi]